MKESNRSVKHLNQPNKPGLSWVKAIPINAAYLGSWSDLIVGRPVESTISYTNLDVKPGFNWLDIADDFPAPFTFTEGEKIDNPQGHIFSYTILQQVPHSDLVSRGQIFRFYSRNEWILVFKSRDGSVRILGGTGINVGAKFSRKLASGTQLHGSSVNTLEFSWESSEQALYLRDPASQLSLDFKSISIIDTGTSAISILVSLDNSTDTPDITLQYWDGFSWVDVFTVTPVSGANTIIDTSFSTPALGRYWFRIVAASNPHTYSNQLQAVFS